MLPATYETIASLGEIAPPFQLPSVGRSALKETYSHVSGSGPLPSSSTDLNRPWGERAPFPEAMPASV